MLGCEGSSSSGAEAAAGTAAAGLDAPEALRIIQLAQRRVQKGTASFASLSQAISKALELARLHPHLDARDLLHPTIAAMQLSYVDRAVRRMRRVLPDTKLRAELLAKDPHEVSEQITRIVASFKRRLAMQPPSQLLSDAWTFTKALRLPDQQLQSHLAGLLGLLKGDLAAAQRLAQQHAGVLLSSSFGGMLERMEQLGQLLGLQEGHAAAEFALRHPYLISSRKQLAKVTRMLHEAPAALRLPLQQLLPSFVAHPSLFKYESTDQLAQRYHELAACFNREPGSSAVDTPAASPSELLALCAATSVRRAAGPGAVTEDPKTAHLKLVLLQRQLLGWEPAHSSARVESVAPEMTKMLKRCPWIAHLQVETCSKRLAALQAALQLPQEAAGQLVLRAPQLLLLKAEQLQQLVGELVQLLGGVEAARKLVLQAPEVLLLKRQANKGGLKPQLAMMQQGQQ
ncbi:hypothetical protein OEZ86_004022 [Tetradesmus obliquus]|nr:hypothetical protein OEZ86_004022 [Tetradesmus obliquus]